MANRYLVRSGNRDLNNPRNWSYTSGGAGGDILGSELITNAADREFSSDTGFWTKGIGWSISSGLASTSISGYYLITSNSLFTVNKWYKITADVIINNGSIIFTSNWNANNTVAIYTSGHIAVFIKAGYDKLYIFSQSTSASIDNISIKEVLTLPTSSDNIIIDANSSIANGDVLSITNTFDCGGFDFSAAAYTFTLSNAAYAFNVYGDIKDSVKRINGFSSTGYLYIKANCNIYSNGATQGWNRMSIDAPNSTIINQDTLTSTNLTIYHYNGEWNTNNQNISINTYYVYTGTKTLTLGSSLFKTGIWGEYDTITTFNYNTSTVEITQNVGLSTKPNRIFYNLILTGISTVTATVNIYSNFTVQNTLTFTGYNSTNNRLAIVSSIIGTPRTITCNGNIVASNVDFRDITLAGTANRDLSAISGGSGDCGGNSGITFTPSQTQYYKHLGGGTCYFKDSTKWYSDSALTTQGRVPLPQDDWFALAGSFNATTTFVVDCPRIGRSMDLSAVSQSVTWSSANAIECYGSYILGANISIIGALNTHLLGRNNYVINTYNKLIPYSFYITPFNSYSYTFLSDFSSARVLGINVYDYNIIGEINFNNYNITAGVFEAYKSSIKLGGGIIRFNSNTPPASYIFRCTGIIDSGSSTIIIEPIDGNNIITFRGWNNSFNKVIFSGSHTGNFIISDNNTFNELVIEKGRKLQITGGSTQTISPTGKFIADGSPTEGITIGSTNTTPFNLVYAGTGKHQVNYCNISYCNATPDRFYAGTNSVNGGNNTGWLFKNYLKKNTIIL